MRVSDLGKSGSEMMGFPFNFSNILCDIYSIIVLSWYPTTRSSCSCYFVFQVMEVRRKFFDISFIALLSDVTKILEFPEPIYNQLQGSNNMTYVVVRTTTGSQAYYFEGGQCEDAAEKALRCLAKKYRLRIEDINLEKKERNDNCSKFYKALRANLGNVDIDQSSRQVRHRKKRSFTGYLKSVSINYKHLLADILKAFGISVTDVNHRNFKTSGYVCCFCIKNRKEEWAMEWIMGERCDTLDAANQSLAKKAIL